MPAPRHYAVKYRANSLSRSIRHRRLNASTFEDTPGEVSSYPWLIGDGRVKSAHMKTLSDETSEAGTGRTPNCLCRMPRRRNAIFRLTQYLFVGSLILGTTFSGKASAARFHVATNGNDGWSGRLAAPNPKRTDGPFPTVERAQAEIRKLKRTSGLPKGGVTISVHTGLYSLANPLQLTDEDSGTPSAPIVYGACADGEVRLVGGRLVSNFSPVTEPAVLNRLDEKARGKVLQADLRALGLTNYGTAAGGGLDLFFRDMPMRLSRWPNEGFVRLIEILGKTPVDVRGTKGCVEGIFTFDGDRPRRWTEEHDVWVHGYWFWDWSDQRQKVKSIDLEHRSIEVEPPYHTYGYRKGQWFYAYNLLSEIDQPGEWYLDRDKGVLYFWPPGPIESGKVIVSVLPTLLTMKDVSHVTLRDFTIEAVRDTAILMSGGTGNRIEGCTVRNTGGSAISISGGSSNGVVSCDIYQCGAGGVSLEGGDRKTLTPAGHYGDNNHIHHYGRWKPMYSAGIGLYGVGNSATHNLIDSAPHQAISFGGNDHQMVFNEIHNVCQESNDAGAIYAGRDWTMRGTVIRNNYLHDITGFEGHGCVGVYLDDMFSGTEIVGNVFYRVTSAAFIGGGRDCGIRNNIFVDCKPAVHVDARAMGWAKYHADEWVKEGREKKTLSGTRYDHPPYSERYPRLPNILAENPWAPEGNVITHNICVGGRWDDIEAEARPMLVLQDNLLDAAPHFVNAAALNFQLRKDSPAYRLGFQRIPIEKIGLYKDRYRKALPPKPTPLP